MKRSTCKRLALMMLCALCFSCAEKTEGVRMAVPDDLCGTLAGYLVREKQLTGVQFKQETFPLMDCCSTTTEWALSSDRIDVAWLCPDAARNLLEKDKRFEIAGPALVNSQIFVVRPGAKPKRIAYSHKRDYLKPFIQNRFGAGCETIPVTPTALPYVYEQGNVDGVVIDVLKGMSLKGEYIRLADNNADVITYVLVVSSDFRHSAKYERVAAQLKDAATKLNDINILTQTLRDEKKLTTEQVRKIISLGARFIPPPAH